MEILQKKEQIAAIIFIVVFLTSTFILLTTITVYAQDSTPQQPSSQESTPEQPTPEEPTTEPPTQEEPEPTVPNPIGGTELAIIVAIVAACVIGVAFYLSRRRK